MLVVLLNAKASKLDSIWPLEFAKQISTEANRKRTNAFTHEALALFNVNRKYFLCSQSVIEWDLCSQVIKRPPKTFL